VRFWLLIFALAGAAVCASCSLLERGLHHPAATLAPLPIPISASTPSGDTVIEGEMRLDGPCLTVVVIEDSTQGETILPIWPVGFAAKGPGGTVGPVIAGPLGDAKDAVGAERLELHGQYVDSRPPDAIVPEACARYRLFVVGRAMNIAT
jgi:hypothetical protein